MKIVIDIETTGLSNKNDEILQVSIIDENKNVLFDEYIKPLYAERWDSAELVNGISPQMVADKKLFVDYKETINNIIKNADFVIGYNVWFDLGFLYENGISRVEDSKIIDVMTLFAEYYGDWNCYYDSYAWKKLILASEHFSYEWEEKAHNSLGDIKATLYVYNELMKEKNKEVFYEIGKLGFDENGKRIIFGEKKFFNWDSAWKYFLKLGFEREKYIIIKHIGDWKREIYLKNIEYLNDRM